MSTYSIKAGDTFTSIAAKFGLTVSALEAANPGVNPNTLQVGQVIKLPAEQVDPTYIIQSGDTFTSIAAKFGTTVAALEAANPGVNPNTLQIGVKINIPSGTTQPSTPVPVPVPTPPQPAPPAANTYKIQSGDTFTSIAAKLGLSEPALEAANPGVNPTALQIGQIINLPPPSTSSPIPPQGPSSTAYVAYSGPASSFPSPTLWAPYSTLWTSNSKLMSYSDSASEIAFIGSAITTVSSQSGVDPRVILCIIMQESGGNVRAGNTNNGVENTGIMQAFNGANFNPNDPKGSIEQMVRDGTVGTSNGPGLLQAYQVEGNWYAAFRRYNSGSVDVNDLNNPLGATADYVQKVANRLMGHVWVNM